MDKMSRNWLETKCSNGLRFVSGVVAPLGSQQASRHSRAGEGEMHMQTVEEAHDLQIGRYQRSVSQIGRAARWKEAQAGSVVHGLVEPRSDDPRAISLLFFSSIITWLLPWMPMSASLM
jgi:hypothetical protein